MDLILDANFLVLPFQFNVEIFDEFERLCGGGYEVHTLERAYNEALNLKDGKYRKLVKKLVDLKDITIIETGADRSVDQDLLEHGMKGYVICTNDRELRNKLDNIDLPHIYLRQKNHLEAENLRRF